MTKITQHKTLIVGVLVILCVLITLLLFIKSEQVCIATDFNICAGMSKEEVLYAKRMHLFQKRIDADTWSQQ